MNLSKEHISIMEHTRDRAANGYYCGDSPEMQELVAEGLMVCVGRTSFCPDPYFALTGKGREELKNQSLKGGDDHEEKERPQERHVAEHVASSGLTAPRPWKCDLGNGEWDHDWQEKHDSSGEVDGGPGDHWSWRECRVCGEIEAPKEKLNTLLVRTKIELLKLEAEQVCSPAVAQNPRVREGTPATPE